MPGFPSAWDLNVYRSGKQGEQLLDPITTRKWRDDYGTYNRYDEDAFAAMGWSSVEVSDSLLPVAAELTWNRTSQVGFVGVDGVTFYRLTLSIGRMAGGEFEEMESEVLTLVPGELTDYLFEGPVEDATMVRVTRLEGRAGLDGPYEEIELTDTTIRAQPLPGCRVLSVTRVREGVRWGHFPLIAESGVTDYENATRYRTKRTIRELKAKTLE
jgi:hypothetical protein